MADGEEIDFDPQTASNALELIANHARDLDREFLDPTSPMARAAAAILCDSRAWLDNHRTPFDDFAGALVLLTIDARAPLSRDDFVAALRNTAIELIQVEALVRLRRTRRS